jgi:hypothetical protein
VGLKKYIFLNSCLGYADKIGCVDYKIAKNVKCSRKLPQNVEYCFFMLLDKCFADSFGGMDNKIFADTASNPL